MSAPSGRRPRSFMDTEDLTDDERNPLHRRHRARGARRLGRGRNPGHPFRTILLRSGAWQRPQQELNDFFIAEDTHFPALESVADDPEARSRGDRARSTKAPCRSFSKRGSASSIRRGGLAPDGEASFSSQYRYKPDDEPDVVSGRDDGGDPPVPAGPAAGGAGRARRAQRHGERAGSLSSAAARRLTFRALASYIAGAIVMPYERILESAEDNAYDIDHLGQNYHGEFRAGGAPAGDAQAQGRGRHSLRLFALGPGRTADQAFSPARPAAAGDGPCLPALGALRRLPPDRPGVSGRWRASPTARAICSSPRPCPSAWRPIASSRSSPRSCWPPTSCRPTAPSTARAWICTIERNEVPVGPACRLCVRRGCAHRQEEALDLQGAETELRTPLVPRRFDVGGSH